MTSPVELGTVLAGKLRVEAVIARGGMGVVVAAHHLKLDQRVAVKFLLPEALAHREAVARFEREARAAARIQSEHTVRVIDVGTLDSGAPYMVMEYLHGCDVGALVAERGRLPVEDAVDYILQASEAIAEAHTLGIIHRDLKPANLFIIQRPDGSPCVKVLDFGISKVISRSGLESESAMTRTGAVLGSPLYMSPEQLLSPRSVDMRTDVWGLGVTLFELLAGRPPFEADSLPALMAAVQNAEPLSLRALCPDLPGGLEGVIEACLEKDPSRRIASVAELTSNLARYAPKRSRLSIDRILRVSEASGLAVSLPPPPSSGSRDGDQTTGEFQRTNATVAPARRWSAIAVSIACVAGGSAWLLHVVRSQRADPTAIPEPQPRFASSSVAVPPRPHQPANSTARLPASNVTPGAPANSTARLPASNVTPDASVRAPEADAGLPGADAGAPTVARSDGAGLSRPIRTRAAMPPATPANSAASAVRVRPPKDPLGGRL